jgi:hypothetical protein
VSDNRVLFFARFIPSHLQEPVYHNNKGVAQDDSTFFQKKLISGIARIHWKSLKRIIGSSCNTNVM